MEHTADQPDDAVATTERVGAPTGIGRFLLLRWPSWLGIVVAVAVVRDPSAGLDLAPVVVAAAAVYLGAAVLRRPSTAWPLFLAAAGVIIAVDTLADVRDATWILLVVTVPVFIFGLVATPGDALRIVWRQAFALVGFGAVATIALAASEDVGAYLVAAALLGHATWDGYHYRANEAVVRSLSEFCAVLDTVIAAVIVFAAT